VVDARKRRQGRSDNAGISIERGGERERVGARCASPARRREKERLLFLFHFRGRKANRGATPRKKKNKGDKTRSTKPGDGRKGETQL